ncbi:MAG: hypothetical protein ABF893_12935, partial [Gluconacetobacter liquefaciens]
PCACGREKPLILYRNKYLSYARVAVIGNRRELALFCRRLERRPWRVDCESEMRNSTSPILGDGGAWCLLPVFFRYAA